MAPVVGEEQKGRLGERRPQEEVTKRAMRDVLHYCTTSLLLLSFDIKSQPPDATSIESRALQSWNFVM